MIPALAVWFGLALLLPLYVDQAHRARALIVAAYPGFFDADAKSYLEKIAPATNIYQSISDVHDFLSSGADAGALPPQCSVLFRRLHWLKWAMATYFAAMLVYAFGF